MKFKDIVLEKIDKLNENVDAVKVSMEKHAMTEKEVYESFTKVQYELDRIRTLINRE